MNNRNFINDNLQKDGCSARGACSLVPSIAALQELLIYIIKQCSYYILELDSFNLNNDNLIKDVISSLSSLVLINELNENNLYSLILQNYYALDNARATYKKACQENNISDKMLIFTPKFDEKSPLTVAISEGEKLLKLKFRILSGELRNYIQIFGIVLKSICSNLSRLYDIEVSDAKARKFILKAVNILNDENLSIDKIFKQIKILAKKDFLLNLALSQEIKERFGPMSRVKVSHSSRKGKAILVSGNNFIDLLHILDLAKSNNIDVYTHSDLLLAHSLEKFRNYENLVGHYGDSFGDCIVDFATFPGAILLTNNSKHNTEFLYRGKIFSNTYNIPRGVTGITDGDYFPIIETSLNSKGFSKATVKPDSFVGFDDFTSESIFDNIIKTLVNPDVKHVYIIVGNSLSELQKDYMDKFLNDINEDEFVISFSYPVSLKNSVMIDFANFYPFMAELISEIFKGYETSDKITFMFNICNITLLSYAIYFKLAGVKDLYLSNCSPRIINPAVFETLIKHYDINLMTNPAHDLIRMRN